ncbi:MAG: threonine synthase [Oscillospiraceae bacterium]|nr:threonine synthase [Oscillospiraceae bacterium]
MKYFSTRNSSYKVSAAEAIVKGLAPDGGLFVPESVPQVSLEDIKALCEMDYRGRAVDIMSRYLEEFDTEELWSYVNAAYGDNFDDAAIAPMHFTDDNTGVLELWHGPTCAFKDMALQMLPHLLTASLKKCGEKRKVCILVATSGDTGKAALEGFADVEGTKILVFYPHNGVSDVQKLQMMTQSGSNVGVSAVYGNFDDAQTGVKNIFADKELAERLSARGWFLSSANSINWGRLLPQIVYYFSAYCDFVNSGRIKMGGVLDFAVPTGNFGNILACWYAKKMGLPVGRLICASNENNVLTDFFACGEYNKNRPFRCTISPSMDILVSSNLERLLYSISGDDVFVASCMKSLNTVGSYRVSEEIKSVIAENFFGGFCTDEETKELIRRIYEGKGYLMDTHTAVACKVVEDYRRVNPTAPTVIVSTASPFKFCDSVLSALGEDSSAPGTELIEKLSETCGLKVPYPLFGLDKREKRFEGVCEKEKMTKTVEGFLA